MSAAYTQTLRRAFLTTPPMVKILLVCLLVLIIMFVSSFLSIILAVPIFHYSFAELLTAMSAPTQEHLPLLKYLQIIQSIFVFIFPALLAAWLYSSDTFGYLKVKGKPYLLTTLLVMSSIIVAIPFLNLVTEWNAQLDLPAWLDGIEKKIVELEASATELTKLFLTSETYTDLIVNMIMIAVLPAIGEELLFRGVLQRLLCELSGNKHWGIILAAFLFSFFHFQFFGFLPRFLLGLYFGYLFVWSGTLWVPVVAHFVNNGVAVLFYHFSSEEMGETMIDRIGTDPATAYALVISVVVSTLLIFAIYKFEKTKHSSSVD